MIVFPSVDFYNQIVSEKIYINREMLSDNFTQEEREAICDAWERMISISL